MTKKDVSYYDLVLYVLSFLLIIATPFLARLIAPLFDWAGYGAMRKFFNELFTAIIWVLEIILLAIFYRKKFKENILSNPETKGVELSLKRIAVISVVTALCIFVISIQIRFQVKPFYDLGEKFNGYDLINNLGIYLRNIIKCIWIVIMLRAMQNFIGQMLKKDVCKVPYAGLVLMLTVGIYDVIVGANTLTWTYLFFYMVYGWLYLLTDRSMIKTYLLVMFIFLF